MKPPPPESEKPGPEIAVSNPGGTPKSSFFPTGKSLDTPPGKSGQTGNRDFSARRPLVRAEVIAKPFDCHKRTVLLWAESKTIPSVRIGGTVRFDMEAVLGAAQ